MLKPVIHIPLPAYLRDWLLHKSGGKQPVVPKRNSQIAIILTAYVTRVPKGWEGGGNTDECIGFAVPQIHGKWAKTWCFLPELQVKRIQHMIRDQFRDQMFQTIRGQLENKNNKLTKMDLIYKFMKEHQIEDSERNYFAIDKIYTRMLKLYKQGIIC